MRWLHGTKLDWPGEPSPHPAHWKERNILALVARRLGLAFVGNVPRAAGIVLFVRYERGAAPTLRPYFSTAGLHIGHSLPLGREQPETACAVAD